MSILANAIQENRLYADGGVILKNPSIHGGTWAYRLIQYSNLIREGSGVILPEYFFDREVTNNQTELLAVVEGLKILPADWVGTVYSDSACTLGRIFKGFKFKNIPKWLIADLDRQKRRLLNWPFIQYVQLDGHPTQAQLKAGIGKRGNPVDLHNVLCDKACGKQAEEFMKCVKPMELPSISV